MSLEDSNPSYSVKENTEQIGEDDNIGSYFQVTLTITDVKHVNSSTNSDSIATVNSSLASHHNIKHSVVICDPSCDSPNVSEFDSIVEDNKNSATTRLQLKLRTALHKIAAAFVICFIVGVFALPIIFFYIRPGPDVNIESSSISMDNLVKMCNTSVMNTSCARDVMITYTALRQVSELTFPFCIQETKDLFCNALSKCDDDPGSVEEIVCQEIRQTYCTAEWRILEVTNATGGIFVCDDYGETVQLNCSDQFDLNNGDSVCSPLCKSFSQHGEVATTILIADNGFAYLINAIGGIIVLIAAIWNRMNMFKYPQVLLVINAVIITVQSIILSLPNITLGKWNPLCSDKFLFNAIENPTTYCKMEAFVGITTIVIYSMFWFVYILHLYLTLIYPLRLSRINRILTSRVTHFIEVASVIIVVATPNIYFLATSQYQIITFPPLFCAAGVDVNFYGTIFPTVVINCVSFIMMLLVLQRIHGAHTVTFCDQEYYYSLEHYKRKSRMSKQKCFSIPEVKIFLTFLFLLVVLALLWISITFQVSSFETTLFHITNYIKCNLGGIRAGLDCEEDRRRFEALSYPYLSAANTAAYAILNLSNLPLVLQYHNVRQSFRRLTKHISSKSATTDS